jgi:ornithine carbamoyltransferase
MLMIHRASERPRAVVALGGNVLLRRGEPLEAANPARAARDAARILDRAGNARVKFMHCLPTYHDTNAAVGRQIMDEARMEEGSR